MSCVASELVCAKSGTTPTLMARLEARDSSYNSTPIVQADVSAITYSVVDLSENSREVIASSSLTVANVIFDTLQTGEIWTEDSTGFNFAHDLGAAALDKAGHLFKVAYVCTLTAGAGSEVMKWDYKVQT